MADQLSSLHAPHNAHTQHLSAPSVSMPTFPPPPTSAIPLEEEQQHDVFAPPQQQDTFDAGLGAVTLAPDAGIRSVKFPEHNPSATPSGLDTEYIFTMQGGVYRCLSGPFVSLYGAGSDTGTTTSTGSSAVPYFSDVIDDDRLWHGRYDEPSANV